MTTIAIIDDHPLYRRALADLAAAIVGPEGVFEGNAVDALLRLPAPPRLVLLDFRLAGRSGAEAVAFVRQRYPLATIVVVSGSEDRREADAALRAGAATFVSKATGLDELDAIVRSALAGRVAGAGAGGRAEAPAASPASTLTPRQLEILALLCAGHSNKEIGLRLDISLATVKTHVAAVFGALGVVSRTQAVIAARRLGLA